MLSPSSGRHSEYRRFPGLRLFIGTGEKLSQGTDTGRKVNVFSLDCPADSGRMQFKLLCGLPHGKPDPLPVPEGKALLAGKGKSGDADPAI